MRTLASAVLIPGRTRVEAEATANEYVRFSSAEGYLAHSGGGNGIDLAAYPPETRIADIPLGPSRDAATSARYAPGATVADALRDVIRFDRGPFFALGTGDEIADQIEKWVGATGIDGFNLRQFLTPATVEAFVEHVVPALQKRGLYRESYGEGTLRGRMFGAPRLPDTHPARRNRGGAGL